MECKHDFYADWKPFAEATCIRDGATCINCKLHINEEQIKEWEISITLEKDKKS